MRAFAWAVAALTVAQLAVGAFSGLQQYDGKGFGYRLAIYPVLMVIPLLACWRWRPRVSWGAMALIWSPFLLDVSGNTLNLFDAVPWWDDAMHFVSWGLLNAGLGLLIVDRTTARWRQVLLITGLGALLAIGWELGEWWTFIRRGVELDTAYEDTLGDEALGTLGALLAGVAVAAHGTGRSTGPAAREREQGSPPL